MTNVCQACGSKSIWTRKGKFYCTNCDATNDVQLQDVINERKELMAKFVPRQEAKAPASYYFVTAWDMQRCIV